MNILRPPLPHPSQMEDVDLEDAINVVEARPTKCIDRVPSSWVGLFVIIAIVSLLS